MFVFLTHFDENEEEEGGGGSDVGVSDDEGNGHTKAGENTQHVKEEDIIINLEMTHADDGVVEESNDSVAVRGRSDTQLDKDATLSAFTS